MTTTQTYECPVHGRKDYTVVGEPPDKMWCHELTDGVTCGLEAEWRIGAPAVHWPGTALKALARESNKW